MSDIYTNTTSVYLLAGMRARFYIPANSVSNMGSFKGVGTYTDEMGVQHTLNNGFYVENEEVGTIVASASDKLEVTYEHNMPEKNSVVFIGRDIETKFRFNIIAVPIHDHSTIVQGGPAYGTYFTDGEED